MIFIIPPTFVAGLIYVITDNLSSAIIIMGIAVAMLFVAIPDYKYFIIAAVAVLALAGAVVVFASGNDVTAFRLVRIKACLTLNLQYRQSIPDPAGIVCHWLRRYLG